MTPGTKVLVEGVVVEPHPFCEGTGLIAVNISDLLFAPAQLRPLADVERMEEALLKIADLEKLTRYKPHPLLAATLPDTAFDEDGYVEMPISMKQGLNYAARIARSALAKETP